MIRRSKTRIAIVAVALTTVLAIVVFGGLLDDPPSTLIDQPLQVQAIVPERGSTVQPTEDIGIDVEDDLAVRFVLDGKNVPEAAVRDEGSGRFFLRPGASIQGAIPVPALRAGTHFVTVVFWDPVKGPSNPNDPRAGQFRWEFNSA